jgi:hypothetical protein
MVTALIKMVRNHTFHCSKNLFNQIKSIPFVRIFVHASLTRIFVHASLTGYTSTNLCYKFALKTLYWMLIMRMNISCIFLLLKGNN